MLSRGTRTSKNLKLLSPAEPFSPLFPPLKATATPFRGKVSRHAAAKASLTVEAALALPLFMMTLVVLFVFLGLFGRLSEENLKRSNEARKLAMYGSMAGDTGPEWIDLCTPVSVPLPFGIASRSAAKLPVRARVRRWIGYTGGFGTGDTASGGQGSGTYFITDNEEVYHTEADCTHLDLTIIETTAAEVGKLRNAYGKRYKKCPGFPKNYTGTVYVTAKGDYCYPDTARGSLTRHVHIVSADELGSLPLCERCAAHAV